MSQECSVSCLHQLPMRCNAMQGNVHSFVVRGTSHHVGASSVRSVRLNVRCRCVGAVRSVRLGRSVYVFACCSFDSSRTFGVRARVPFVRFFSTFGVSMCIPFDRFMSWFVMDRCIPFDRFVSWFGVSTCVGPFDQSIRFTSSFAILMPNVWFTSSVLLIIWFLRRELYIATRVWVRFVTAFRVSSCSVMLRLVPFFSARFARQFVAEPALVCVVGSVRRSYCRGVRVLSMLYV